MSTFNSEKYDIVDVETPKNVNLAGHFKRSFAFYTLSQRLPIILTQVIDTLTKRRDELANQSEEEENDVKEIIANISKLKYELQTDKKLQSFDGNESDEESWNTFLSTLNETNDSFFQTVWLYAECYLYRRLKSFFEKTKTLKDFDYFRTAKQNGLTAQNDTIILVAENVSDILNKTLATDDELQDYFHRMLKLSLWGNRCDLSISLGREIKTSGNSFAALDSLDPFILVDKINEIWECVKHGHKKNVTIDIVQDNAGYELYTDLVFAAFLLEQKLAGKIRFHIKGIPWFISDVNPHDFHWTLNALADNENTAISEFGKKLLGYLESGQFELCTVDNFWTSAYEFYRMQEVNSKLYETLAESHLVIFKGDLNYRKLLGDFNWPYDTTFEKVLRGFKPTNICSLRTVKADLICELKNGVAEELAKTDAMWMETGQYAVIHFGPKNA